MSRQRYTGEIICAGKGHRFESVYNMEKVDEYLARKLFNRWHSNKRKLVFYNNKKVSPSLTCKEMHVLKHD